MNNQQQTNGYSKNYQERRKPDLSNVMYGKVPPQAIELEKAVLGAIMLEKDKLDDVLEILPTAEYFYADAHQRIYEAIISLPKRGQVVDMLTITDALRRSDELELIGGPFFLAQLTMGVVTSAHVIPHARIVMEKYFQRELIRICGETLGQAYEDKADVFDMLEEIERAVYELTYRSTGSELQHIGKDVIDVMEDINHKIKEKVTFTGLPTGFADLDALTGGWQKKDLIILAARPSVGKTAFALNLCYNASSDKVKPGATAFFSLEMDKSQIIKRLMSRSSGIKLESIRNPTKLSDFDLKGLYEYNDKLTSYPIYIDDTAAISVAQLKGKLRRLKKKLSKKGGELGMAVIDYLQLMTGSKHYRGNREQEISGISRDLKELAKELDIPIVALSQLSREVEKRGDKKPTLADLRESGAIEQDADIVALMYRPLKDEIAKNPVLANANYLDIAKHRNGDLDAMPIYKDLSIQKFSDTPLITGYIESDWINKREETPGFIPLNKNKAVWHEDEPAGPDDLPF